MNYKMIEKKWFLCAGVQDSLPWPLKRAWISQLSTLVFALVFMVPASAQDATLIRLTDTSLWTTPSPNPSAITFLPGLGQLLIADSEVNEIPTLFTGDNLYISGRTGVLASMLSTIGITQEPSGLTHDPVSGHLFIATDNSPRRVYEIGAGFDGQFFTADDIVTSFSTVDFGSVDAEGLSWDPVRGVLHLVDGLGDRLYTISPGSNGLFDGVPPSGDDVVTSFNVAALGITDPEGVTFDPLSEQLYVIGKPRRALLHVTTGGQALRTVTLDSSALYKPAGLMVAPSSFGDGADSLYVVDRGVDNNSDPSENDGRLFEFALPPLTGNSPPLVAITVPNYNSVFTVGDTIGFAANGSDVEEGDLSASIEWISDRDGPLGNGAAVYTTSLSVGTHRVSASVTDGDSLIGKDTVDIVIQSQSNTPPQVLIASPVDGETFNTTSAFTLVASANDAEDGDLSATVVWSSDLDGALGEGNPTVSLSVGTHLVTAIATDGGGGRSSDTIWVQITPDSGGTSTVRTRVATGSDDAEELKLRNMSLTSDDLELAFDGKRRQLVGLRFTNVEIPQGANILTAAVQFQADERSSKFAFLEIFGEDSSSAEEFASTRYNLSARAHTPISVGWTPPPWNSVGAAGAAELTPDLAPIIQYIVSRQDWGQGNDLALLIRGDGVRVAESFEGSPAAAAELIITYTLDNAIAR